MLVNEHPHELRVPHFEWGRHEPASMAGLSKRSEVCMSRYVSLATFGGW
jgi:hypothetical protein